VLARVLALAAVVSACLLAACGTEKTVLPDPDAAPTGASREIRFPQAGMTVRLRQPIRVARRSPPAVFRFSMPSGAVVSALAYKRREPVPSSPADLRQGRRRLQDAVIARDPHFRVDSARIVRVAGAPGVEVVGTQDLSGGRLRTRSVHLYKGAAEYVFELIAARGSFAKVDRSVFSPMLRTLEVTGRIRS
jgi:hypothetical protein